MQCRGRQRADQAVADTLAGPGKAGNWPTRMLDHRRSATSRHPARQHAAAWPQHLDPPGGGVLGTLEEIAAKEQLNLARFVGVLYDEIEGRIGNVQNFTSFLRVTCLHYLRHQELHAQQVAERMTEAVLPLAAD